MTKRDEQKAATKARILAAAHEAFRHHGYEDVTIRGVAEAAKVSTGAIFASVKDKADLFRQAMGEEPPDMRAFLEDVIITCIGHADPRVEQLYAKAFGLRRHLIGGHA